MNTRHSLNNKKGGFVQFLIMIVLLIALMNYFGIGLGEVFNFITQILNFILTLIQSILNAIVSLGQSVQYPK